MIPQIPNVVYALLTVGVLHFLDAFFTIKTMEKAQKEGIAAEDLEFNYHKVFFKKFGLHKGGAISFSISMCVMMVIAYYLFTYGGLIFYILVGMLISQSYTNIANYIEYDKTVEVFKNKI